MTLDEDFVQARRKKQTPVPCIAFPSVMAATLISQLLNQDLHLREIAFVNFVPKPSYFELIMSILARRAGCVNTSDRATFELISK